MFFTELSPIQYNLCNYISFILSQYSFLLNYVMYDPVSFTVI